MKAFICDFSINCVDNQKQDDCWMLKTLIIAALLNFAFLKQRFYLNFQKKTILILNTKNCNYRT